MSEEYIINLEPIISDENVSLELTDENSPSLEIETGEDKMDLSLEVDDPTVGLDLNDISEEIDLEMDDEHDHGTSDYNKLKNKPTLNGETIIGDMNEIDPTVPEWAKAETKPTYTYQEVEAVGAENEIHMSEIDRMFTAVFGI